MRRHFRHQPVDRVSLPRRDDPLGHVVEDRLLQNLGSRLADRPHEVALRHDARDVVVVSQDYDASNAMQLRSFAISSNDLSAVVVTTALPFSSRIVATFMLVSAGDFWPGCDIMSQVLGCASDRPVQNENGSIYNR